MPDQRIDSINLQISEAMDAYEKLLAGLPEPAERSADQEKGRIAQWEKLQTLKQKKEMVERSVKDDIEFQKMQSEFAKQPAVSGAITREAIAPSGEYEVKDHEIYRGPYAVGQHVSDIWYKRTSPDSQIGKLASRRIEQADNRRHKIAQMYRAATPTFKEEVGSKGGIFLETTRSFELVQSAFNNGILASKCRKMTMGGAVTKHEIYGRFEQSRKDGYRNGGFTWVPTNELENAVASATDFENILTIEPRKLTAGFNMSEELAMDVPFLDGIIRRMFNEELVWDVDRYIFEGIGGKEPCLGLMNSPAKLTVDKTGTQAVGSIVNQNILDMRMHINPQGWRNAIWIYNQFLEAKLLGMYFELGDSGELSRLFIPGAGPTMESMLYGRPAFPHEICKVAGTEGDIVLLDLSQYHLTDRGGIQVASSVEVEFWAGQKSVRMHTWLDGQSLWKDKIEMYEGTGAYVSPIVTLETR